MDKQKLLAFVTKYRERFALIGLAVGLVMFVGIGLYMQKNNQEQKSKLPDAAPKKVEFTPKQAIDADPAAGKVHSYYLQPSPTELLAKLTALQGLNDDAIARQFVSLRVLWPAYFFSAEGESTEKQLLLDVSEDGFGVVMRGSVTLTDYPLINVLQQGDKVWVGGEISAVDPEGTGTVYLRIEYVGTSMPADSPLNIVESGK